MIDSLINKGVLIVGDEGESTARRVVIVGSARGGTSMVAGALYHLGVFMGDAAVDPVFEDTRLAEAFEAQRSVEIANIMSDYDQKHDVWGWKRPSSIGYLDYVKDSFDSAHFIFIFKDIFSIANRNSISMQAELLSEMQRACKQYLDVVDFIKRRSPRALLVSYDKAVSDPGHFVENLQSFIGKKFSQDALARAADSIRPNPEKYLDMSRALKSQGFVDVCELSQVKGWARYLYNEKAPTLEVYVNGNLAGECEANIYRSDLEEQFSQSCAFEFRFGEPLKAGDEVRVRVKNEIYDLENSPWIIGK